MRKSLATRSRGYTLACVMCLISGCSAKGQSGSPHWVPDAAGFDASAVDVDASAEDADARDATADASVIDASEVDASAEDGGLTTPDHDAAITGCELGTHSCGGACVSDYAVTSCGELACRTCAGDPHGEATCDGTRCGLTCDPGYALVAGACTLPPLVQQAYVKASNTENADVFGSAVALSADGMTLAVAANGESSSATGVNGNQASNAALTSGAVYVFHRVGATWSQQAYLKASNTDADDLFGSSLALSADGNTLAVGAIREDGPSTGVGGAQGNHFDFADSGAVYVFQRVGTEWTQEAYVKASNTGLGDRFGTDVALAADGNTLAVGARFEGSPSVGIGGDQWRDTAPHSGAVYVFRRSGTLWSQQAYVKASNTDAYDEFGAALALSADGSVMVVGARGESSSATGVGGNQLNNDSSWSGAAYVFRFSGSSWAQEAYIKASNAGREDAFGYDVTLSADGDELAVGAPYEDSAAVGVDGDESSEGALDSGAVYLFHHAGTTWAEVTYVKASNTGADDRLGSSVALSGDGATLAIGAFCESSAATGIGGDQLNESAWCSGALYVFRSDDEGWSQESYVKASNTGSLDWFAGKLAVSAIGDVLVATADTEDSAAIGIGGDQYNNAASASGAAYVFAR